MLRGLLLRPGATPTARSHRDECMRAENSALASFGDHAIAKCGPRSGRGAYSYPSRAAVSRAVAALGFTRLQKRGAVCDHLWVGRDTSGSIKTVSTSGKAPGAGCRAVVRQPSSGRAPKPTLLLRLAGAGLCWPGLAFAPARRGARRVAAGAHAQSRASMRSGRGHRRQDDLAGVALLQFD
jgi:hypothetical protein